MLFSQPINYSEEQKEIINAFGSINKIRINAYAGSGKTTTLLEIAKNYPNENFLIVCFNRSVADEIENKAQMYDLKNVHAKTIHALAYHNLMRQKGGKVKIVKNADMIKELNESRIHDDIRELVRAYKVYEAFCNSEFTEINENSIKRVIRSNRNLYNSLIMLEVYSIIKEYEKNKISYDFVSILNNVTNRVVKNVTTIVSDIDSYIISPHCKSVTHAAYLKMLHRYVAKYHKIPGDYTAIMIDEAQDINGIMVDIIQSLEIPKKVAVGDKHQSIYGWNGAVNALAQLTDWQEFYLTTSFRFKNQEIIDLANKFLKNIKKETRLMRPCEKPKDITGIAYVTRTNASVMEHIAQIDSPFKLTRPIDSVFEPLLVADKIIKFFVKSERMDEKVPEYVQQLAYNCSTIESFLETIKNVDIEMYDTIERVYQMRSRGIFVNHIYAKALSLLDPNSDYTITTAHTAKGLEYKEIILASDFMIFEDIIRSFLSEREKNLEPSTIYANIIECNPEFSEIIDQINLQYVAVTRASEKIVGPGLSNIERNFSKALEEIAANSV